MAPRVPVLVVAASLFVFGGLLVPAMVYTEDLLLEPAAPYTLLIALGSLLGVWLPVLWFACRAGRHRRLVFDNKGIAWEDPGGAPWSVGWGELDGVAVSVHRRFQLSGARLDLFPESAAMRERRPELDHLWERDQLRGGYAVSLLAPTPDVLAGIDDALRDLRPGVYRGITAG
ncbi:hypothetical protein D5S17_16445 [Pseudonocardiaceae bacterium YIM PH 21723]|nr:hypothetical protein D5S17_16445 [Pseudonocardiaceae bacterium YIM PH 21723]